MQHTEVLLSEQFPITSFRYIQMNRNLNDLHYHRCYEIGVCLEGSGMFGIGNQMLSFRAGDVSFLFPGQPHIAQSPNELPSRWLFIHADLDRLLPSALVGRLWAHSQALPGVIHSQSCPNLESLVKMVVSELEAGQPGHREVIGSLLGAGAELLLRLDPGQPKDGGYDWASGAYFAVSPALVYITRNYAEPISLDALAGVCGLSATHFRALFRQALGASPMQYTCMFRIRMARTLLRSTALPVIDIAQRVGYTSISCFNRAFKSETGRSPSQYRGAT